MLPEQVRAAHSRLIDRLKTAETATNIGWAITPTAIASKVEGWGLVETKIKAGSIIHTIDEDYGKEPRD